MRKFVVLGGGLLLVILLGASLFFFGARDIDITGQAAYEITGPLRGEPERPIERTAPKSSLTGLPCENANRRPLAVMLAADPVTRPLSGISEADVVIEMPVTMDQVTRLMALYQCSEPKELGSVRSSRHDFLPLAAGFDAIYGHWGGSHFALEKLATGTLDNIDALVNPYNAYWRKRGIPGPHDGFTSYERLWTTAGKLGYRLTLAPSLPASPEGDRGNPAGSPRSSGARDDADISKKYQPKSEPKARDDGAGIVLDSARTIKIDYNPNGFAVRWEYDAERNVYIRFRAGKPEIDKNNGRQVEAAILALMQATQKHLEGQYTDVKVIGEGRATIYQNGTAIPGRWRKNDFRAPLKFIDSGGNQIPFMPGKVWIEIITEL